MRGGLQKMRQRQVHVFWVSPLVRVYRIEDALPKIGKLFFGLHCPVGAASIGIGVLGPGDYLAFFCAVNEPIDPLCLWHALKSLERQAGTIDGRLVRRRLKEIGVALEVKGSRVSRQRFSDAEVAGLANSIIRVAGWEGLDLGFVERLGTNSNQMPELREIVAKSNERAKEIESLPDHLKLNLREAVGFEAFCCESNIGNLCFDIGAPANKGDFDLKIALAASANEVGGALSVPVYCREKGPMSERPGRHGRPVIELDDGRKLVIDSVRFDMARNETCLQLQDLGATSRFWQNKEMTLSRLRECSVNFAGYTTSGYDWEIGEKYQKVKPELLLMR